MYRIRSALRTTCAYSEKSEYWCSKKKRKKRFPHYKRFDEVNCDAEASLMNKDKMVVLLDWGQSLFDPYFQLCFHKLFSRCFEKLFSKTVFNIFPPWKLVWHLFSLAFFFLILSHFFMKKNIIIIIIITIVIIIIIIIKNFKIKKKKLHNILH